LRMGDDYELFLRISRHYESGYVDAPLVLYRQHSTQGTRTWGKQLQQGAPWEFLVLKKIVDRYPDVFKELGREKVNQRLSKPYAALAYACLADGDHRNARRLMRAAIHYWPHNLSYLRYFVMTFLTPPMVAKLKGFSGRTQGFRPGTEATNRWHSFGSSNP
jgi:hypothetical protein